MSLPNTGQSPQFLEEQPDWSRPFSIETSWRTDIAGARDGSEQRTRRRLSAMFRISYVIAALNVGQFSVRRAKSLLEQSAAIVVPIWSDQFVLGNNVGTGAVDANLGESLSVQKFKAGSYAYFTQSGRTPMFRLIESIAGETLSLAAGGSQTFTAGATVYPCIVGMPSEGVSFTALKLDATDEAVVIQEL